MTTIRIPSEPVQMINLQVEKISGDLAREVAKYVNSTIAQEFTSRGVNGVIDRDLAVTVQGELTYVPINAVPLVNRFLRKQNAGKVSTLYEVDQALFAQDNPLEHSDCYSYSGYCLGGFDHTGKPNRDSVLAANLVAILNNQGGEWKDLTISQLQTMIKKNGPIVLSQRELDLVYNQAHGAVWMPQANIVVSPEDFNPIWRTGGKFNRVNERGVPEIVKSGTRNLYANPGAGRGVFLGNVLNVGASGGCWSSSSDYSRVVRTFAEGDALKK